MLKTRWLSSVTPAILLALVTFASTLSAAEWKEKVLYSFQGGTDGSTPVGGVVFDSAGNVYGATQDGGSASCRSIYECGTVYQLTPPATKGDAWTETVLYVFQGNAKNDGASPFGGLVMDSSGNLYGTTAYGGTGDCVLLGSKLGCGAVFELSPPAQKGGAWTEKILYSFPNSKRGYVPWGNLVFDKSGNLYASTIYGGDRGTTCDLFYGGQCGVVFELSPPKQKGGKWTEKVLHSFGAIATGKQFGDGASPNGELVFDDKGNVYGTTYLGGYNCPHNSGQGCGTAFKLKPPTQKGGAWTETILHRFNQDTSDNGLPSAGLVMDAKGNLYGTTVGTVFRLAPPSAKSSRWRETILYTLGQDAYDPKGALIFDQSGDLYGTTYVGSGGSLQGSVFQLKPNKNGGWTFGVIHGFLGPPDGDFPTASLVFGKNGDLYSTTQAGGTGQACQGGCGTVFEVSP
jgi:hypothetical protein